MKKKTRAKKKAAIEQQRQQKWKNIKEQKQPGLIGCGQTVQKTPTHEYTHERTLGAYTWQRLGTKKASKKWRAPAVG